MRKFLSTVVVVGLCVFTFLAFGESFPRAGTTINSDIPTTHDNWTVSCCIDLNITISNEDLGANVLWVIHNIAQSGPGLVITLPKAELNIGNVARFFRVDGSSKKVEVIAADGSVIYGGANSYNLDDQYSSATFAVIDGIGWGVIH